MDNKTKLSMGLIFSMGIYLALTLPMFIAFFSMDINTGEYIGIIYPKWLCFTIGAISGILGAIAVNKIEKKLKKNKYEDKK